MRRAFTRDKCLFLVGLLCSAVNCAPGGGAPADLADGGGGPTGAAGTGPGGAGGSSTGPVFDEHLYVPSNGAIYVYDIGPGASDQPSRVLKGPKTRIESPMSLVVDKLGALYVVNYDRDVTVFAPGANGDVAPFFTFASDVHPRSITQASNPTVIGWTKSSESYDARVYVFSDPYQTTPGAVVGSFAVPGVQGGWSWSPSASFGCGATNTRMGTCFKVPKPVADLSVSCPTPDINACLAEGSPYFYLWSRGLGNPTDAVRFRPDGKLTMAWSGPDTVGTYEVPLANPTDDYALLQRSSVVTGPATLLAAPMAVAFDKAGNMYVASYGRASWQGLVTVYPPDADGDVAPIRVLGQLDMPFGLAIGP